MQCGCGAKVRIAPEAAGCSVRCPRCHEDLSAPARPIESQPVAMAVAPAPATAAVSEQDGAAYRAGAADVGLTCPICLTAVQPGELVRRCQSCDQLHHQECWAEIGGCSTFGCAQAPAVEKSEQSLQTPLAAWGDTKKCPACGETIKAIALKCRYCQTTFPSVDPLTAADLRTRAQSGAEVDSFKRHVVTVFALSIIGILAPVMAIVSLVFLLPRRQKLAKAGPLFTIMGWTAVVLSWLYCLLILAFMFAAS